MLGVARPARRTQSIIYRFAIKVRHRSWCVIQYVLALVIRKLHNVSLLAGLLTSNGSHRRRRPICRLRLSRRRRRRRRCLRRRRSWRHCCRLALFLSAGLTLAFLSDLRNDGRKKNGPLVGGRSPEAAAADERRRRRGWLGAPSENVTSATAARY